MWSDTRRDCDDDDIALAKTMVARFGEIALATMMSTGLSLLQRCNNQTERDEIPTTTTTMMKAILMITIMQQSNTKRERERERDDDNDNNNNRTIKQSER